MKNYEEMLKEKDYISLRSTFSEMQPADAALILEELPREDLAIIFRLLPKQLAADTFAFMESEAQQDLISEFSDKELENVIEGLFVDDTVDIIEEMPANVVKRIISHASAEKREQINKILKYPKNSAGTIMTTEFVELKADMTRAQVFDSIRKAGVDRETVYDCYVTDSARHLIGVVSVKDLIIRGGEETTCSEIMEDDVISANALDDREDVVNIMKKYGFLALPVTDGENRLIGIITGDDAIDVFEEEATEDIEKMAAITPSDKPYLKMSTLEIWKARIPWLLLLMVSATFTGMIISSFESALSRWVALTAFIPMLMDTGGNSGSQASVTIIRALSIGDLQFKDVFKVLWKELRVAILCAISLAVVNFAKIQLIDVLLLKTAGITIPVTIVVCITLAFTIICAKLVGCSLPLIAKKLGFDPAVMASPFITTIVDALSLTLYFKIASVILGI